MKVAAPAWPAPSRAPTRRQRSAGPFGGFKQSGLGRELGREGLEAFQETKHVHMESRIERKEWWYPYREYGAD